MNSKLQTPNSKLPNRNPKIAIVCDWLTNMGGAEKTVLALHKAFPDAPIYTSVFDQAACPDFKGLDIRTSYLQRLPGFLRNRHQLFPVLRAHAFRKLDMSDYDIIISSASAEAKAVRVPKGAVHICYCHTPTRYYWSHYKDYLRSPGFGLLNPLIRLVIPPFVAWMRRLDLKAVKGVDHFIANSSAVAERIKKYYKRGATIIHPPLEMQHFRNINIDGPRSGFIVVGRQVPYKRMDLAVQACTKLGLPLTLISNGGPEHERLKAMAGATVQFVNATDAEKAKYLAKAEAFIFPQEEDFGIVQIEPLAVGTPVIAYAKGGALDIVQDGKTGLLFKEQTVEGLINAIKRFQKLQFNHKAIRTYSQQFSEERFVKQIQDFTTKATSKDTL